MPLRIHGARQHSAFITESRHWLSVSVQTETKDRTFLPHTNGSVSSGGSSRPPRSVWKRGGGGRDKNRKELKSNTHTSFFAILKNLGFCAKNVLARFQKKASSKIHHFGSFSFQRFTPEIFTGPKPWEDPLGEEAQHRGCAPTSCWVSGKAHSIDTCGRQPRGYQI